MAPLSFATEAVRTYSTCFPGATDPPHRLEAARAFAYVYSLAGFQQIFAWEEENVWGSDFRDETRVPPNLVINSTDTTPWTGTDVPDVYFFSGHGSMENLDDPNAPNGDFILTCSPATPGGNQVDIQHQCLWGNPPGQLKFMFLDSSFSMILDFVTRVWWPVFGGLHMAVGHSGTFHHDAYDSLNRTSDFATFTVGSLVSSMIPQMSVSDAWMVAGIEEVQSGVCAVAVAVGATRDEAIDRRENEKVYQNLPDPSQPTWIAFKWSCSP
jgi:hypothetical protein